MMKRLVALFLAAVMLLTLSACGGSGKKEEGASQEPEGTAETDETAAVEAEQTEEAPAEDGETADAGDEPETKPVSDWKPDSPVTIVIPYGMGNINDTSIRVLAQYVEKYLGQVVYLENIEGESPAFGWEALKNRDADGLTLGVLDLPAFNSSIVNGLKAYGTASFEMICCHVAEASLVVVRKSDNRFRSLDDLAEYGKEHQGELIAATDGEGGSNHAAVQAFAKSAGFTYGVNHQDSVQNELQALRDETADFCVATVADVAARDTDLRVLGVFSQKRVSAYPDVPTLGELGYYDGELGIWRCIVAPDGVSSDVIAFYEDAFRQAMEDPGYLEASTGITTQFKSAAEAASVLRQQQAFVRGLSEAFWIIDVPAAEEAPPEA